MYGPLSAYDGPTQQRFKQVAEDLAFQSQLLRVLKHETVRKEIAEAIAEFNRNAAIEKAENGEGC